MRKAFTVVYKVHNNLYVNLTNKCSAACVFCLRQNMDHMENSDPLWLDHEPDFEEVKAAFGNFDVPSFNEIVFCGFGEPTEKFDLLIKCAAWIKETYNKPIRINTNGHGNLINGRDIIPEMKGKIDTLSISLNNPDAKKYQELVRSQFGEKSFDSMISFAKEAVNYVPNVIFTTVDTTLSKEEEAKCQKICYEIGVKYRIRPWES